MKAHKKIIYLLFSILLIAILFIPTLVDAQSSTPYEELVQKIQQRAQKDVEMGREAASIADLQTLFGTEAETLGMTMVEVLDIYETAYAAATPPKTWVDDLTPNAGWLAAAILFVLFILRDTLKDYLTRFLNWLGKGLYNHLAGYKPFWWIALRKYREALVETHQELKIPFRPGLPLQMGDVYVPLKVEGSQNQELLDAYKALSQHNRLMVVGAPGSGKTMLMRHIALTYARVGLNDFHGQPVPVLLELHRLINDSKLSLLEHLTKALERNNFPNAENFIKAGLERGNLMLLFDGFDEVNQDARGRVAEQIKDFLNAKSNCRAVITCRTAVYNNEFADFSDQKLEIAEFTDQQIQRFLGTWETEMPADKSIKHLLNTLRERPRIMALARNPLLLTIIAYLYSDTAFILPHSRSEFYSQATTVLLDQWDQAKGHRNKYKASHKRLVLQALALYFQERASSEEQDRRSVDLVDTLNQIEEVLPSLNIEPSHAQDILDEIVERSGLLLALDGGTRYQFSHLTLQEFFAALALESFPDKLILLFDADPGTWRETVKLWCGLEQDSTEFLESIAKIDPITALETLSNTQQVDSKGATEFIEYFFILLGDDKLDQDRLRHALALVAADPHPRGIATFRKLTKSLANTRIPINVRVAIAHTLALTNLPQAVIVLAQHAQTEDVFQPLLTQMGDLAVPALEKRANEGELWALDALYIIGTPQAVLALTPLLWIGKETLQYHSAWYLGAMLSHPNIEIELSKFELSIQQKKAEGLDWVWEPFEPDSRTSIRIIVGRIAYLLNKTPSKILSPHIRSLPVDQRLAIPLCTLKTEKREILSATLSEAVQDILERRLAGNPTPTSDDWRNILHPSNYIFNKSFQAWSLKMGIYVLIFLSLWQMSNIVLTSPQLITWGNGLTLLLGGGIVFGAGLLGRISFDTDGSLTAIMAIGSFILGPVIAIAINAFLNGNWMTVILLGGLPGLVIGGLLSLLIADAKITESQTRLRPLGISLIAVTFGFLGWGLAFGLMRITVGMLIGLSIFALVGAFVSASIQVSLSEISKGVIIGILAGFLAGGGVGALVAKYNGMLADVLVSIIVVSALMGALLGALVGALIAEFSYEVDPVILTGTLLGALIGLLVVTTKGEVITDMFSELSVVRENGMDVVLNNIWNHTFLNVWNGILVVVIMGMLVSVLLGYLSSTISFVYILFGTLSSVTIYYSTTWLNTQWGEVVTSISWIVLIIWNIGLLWWGYHLERRAKNPLHGLLDINEDVAKEMLVQKYVD